MKESDTIIDIGINPLPPDFIIERAIRLFKGVGGKRNISNTHSRDFHFLRSGVAYGKKALTIYHSCCKELGFDITKSSRFDLQQGLYAHNATPEGYGVWMLPHSDLTGDAKSWANIIEGDYIYEVWNKVDYEDHKDVRIAFAKQGDGEYVFMGIYELQKVENINQRKDGVYITVKKIYKKVLEVYPEI